MWASSGGARSNAGNGAATTATGSTAPANSTAPPLAGSTSGHIVAMGGGGFSMEPTNLALDRYVLGLVERERPRVCFLPTASGDSLGYVKRFHTAFRALGAETSHLSVFNPPAADLAAFVLEQEAIYVGGGNTRNLMVLWREWGLDVALRAAWARGVVLAGISAGMICWFEQGLTDSRHGRLSALPCLGFLPGSATPHYDGEAERRPAYHRLVASGELAAGYAADDGAALHFVGTRLEAVVASRPNARAYRVERHPAGDGVTETPLPTRVVGAR